MTDNVIKFGKARKALARSAKEKKAAINRERFGRTKSEKERKRLQTEALTKKLDGHKRDKPKSNNEER